MQPLQKQRQDWGQGWERIELLKKEALQNLPPLGR